MNWWVKKKIVISNISHEHSSKTNSTDSKQETPSTPVISKVNVLLWVARRLTSALGCNHTAIRVPHTQSKQVVLSAAGKSPDPITKSITAVHFHCHNLMMTK